jgi:hypothetical protein
MERVLREKIMSCGVSITIKNYHNGGGDLTLKLTGAQYSDKAGNSGVFRLIITRKPDQYSSRLGMFAFLRTQPGYQSLGFTEITLNFTQCNDAGASLSLTTNVYYGVAVESVKPLGNEEVITFIARSKSPEVKIP